MLIAAFDPGSSYTGWALVRGGTARATFLRAGRIESHDSLFVTLLRDIESITSERISGVAVEQPAGFIYEKQRGAQVIATAAVAGGLSWTARTLGYDVVSVPAVVVRTVLFGKSKLAFKSKTGDMDRAVKAALPRFVDGLPNTTNTHVRDALALAVAANWMWLSRSQRRSA